MAEFRRHHVLARLLQLLGAREETRYDDVLASVTAAPTPWLDSVEALRHATELPAEFDQLVAEVKASQSPDLEPILYVLSKAVADPTVSALLAGTAGMAVPPPTAAAAAAASGAVSDREEVETLRQALAEATVDGRPEGKFLEADLDVELAQRRREQKLAQLPRVPEWQTQRPFMGGDYPVVRRAIEP